MTLKLIDFKLKMLTEKHVKFPFKYVYEICILSDCRSFAFDFRLLDFGFWF